MPMIRVEILEGRPDETKRELAAKLTATLSEVMNLPPEATHVIIEEHARENWARGGVRFSEG